jgi:uncharacterized protein (TIGR02246 family)
MEVPEYIASVIDKVCGDRKVILMSFHSSPYGHKGTATMHRLFSVLLLMILSACASLPTDVQATKDQIAAATQAWQMAYDSRDPKAIVSMYDEDAVLWGTTAKTIAPNPAAIWEYFKGAASRPNARVVIGEQHIRVFGETAFNSGYYTFTDIRDGQMVPRLSRFTLVFHRKAGKWLLVAHHSSAMP